MAPRSKLRLGAACQFAKGMDAGVGEQGSDHPRKSASTGLVHTAPAKLSL